MFVDMEDIERPVIRVIVLAIKRIRSAPQSPDCPTIVGNLRNIITPRIVKTLGVITPPKVPNRAWGLLVKTGLEGAVLSIYKNKVLV
jgi:hypothetical protein